MNHFLSKNALLQGGPRGLVRATERLLIHAGFQDVRVVDGANDMGADLLAVKFGEKWVVQCKWTSGKTIDETGVNDCERAKRNYVAERALLITNAKLSPKAIRRRKSLQDIGVDFTFWDGQALERVWKAKLSDLPSSAPVLRDYQQEAADEILRSLKDTGKAFLVLATGLGKTMVASKVIQSELNKGSRNVLVLAHLKELVEQLERATWTQLPKTANTQVLHSDSKPKTLDGVTFSTPDSMLLFSEYNYTPDVIVIDEAHHVGATGMYAELINRWPKALLLGLTATPWRGDKFDIQSVFGLPSFTMGIAQGMARGWLSNVDYRIFADNIDWDFVRSMSKHNYSIKDLNKSLFLPQRDELIVENLRQAWLSTNKPQAIIFCATIEHADEFAKVLKRSEHAWVRTQSLHSDLSKRDRDIVLNNFRLGRIPIITCVDVFNEGVDVPDVNIICFLRVTHSRKIFVQQLGRGLRLSSGKTILKVLDFVTDIRRVAAANEFKKQIRDEFEKLELGSNSDVKFSDETSGVLLDYWIQDAADLETAHDDVTLDFPSPELGA